MSGRQARIEQYYRVNIPGVLLPNAANPGADQWHPFLMSAEDLLTLHQSIRDALGLDR